MAAAERAAAAKAHKALAAAAERSKRAAEEARGALAARDAAAKEREREEAKAANGRCVRDCAVPRHPAATALACLQAAAGAAWLQFTMVIVQS